MEVNFSLPKHPDSIFGMIYDELKAKIEHLPGKYAHYTDVLDALDREAFGDIILDGNTFWVEDGTGEYTDTTYAKLINYIVNYKGYKYIYTEGK